MEPLKKRLFYLALTLCFAVLMLVSSSSAAAKANPRSDKRQDVSVSKENAAKASPSSRTKGGADAGPSVRVSRNENANRAAPAPKQNIDPGRAARPSAGPKSTGQVKRENVQRPVMPRSEQTRSSGVSKGAPQNVKPGPVQSVQKNSGARIEQARPSVPATRKTTVENSESRKRKIVSPIIIHKPAADKNQKQNNTQIAAPAAKSSGPAKNSESQASKTVSRDNKTAAGRVSNKIQKENVHSNSSRAIEKAAVNSTANQKTATTIQKSAVPQNAPAVTTKSITEQRRQRRERIIRGTGGNEIAIPANSSYKSAQKAVSAIDSHSNRNAINRNVPVRNTAARTSFERGYQHGSADRRYERNNHYDRNRHDRDGGWWRRDEDHHDRHTSNIFLTFSFSGGYFYNTWTPAVYEPVYTPAWEPIVSCDASPVSYTSVTYWGNCRPVVYHHGHHRNVSYFYPGYHRRYMFVSVGGFWPDYTYARYYWYGYHPWYWYGPEPASYVVSGDTYNYYTYDTGSNYPDTTLAPGTIVNGVEVPDYDGLRAAASTNVLQTSSQLPAKLPELPQAEKPAEPTESDLLFDQGVAAFGDGNYPAAIEKFQRAVRLEPDDVILPFAYAQALFANNDYEQAASVIETALNLMAPAKPEVFFPRGLYKDDNILTSQVKNLERAVLMNPSNSELQLLYGYQLLGMGQPEQAKTPLEAAKRNAKTAGPATSLLNLIERAQQESGK